MTPENVLIILISFTVSVIVSFLSVWFSKEENLLSEYETCYECGGLFLRGHCKTKKQKVRTVSNVGETSLPVWRIGKKEEVIFFCSKHEPKWDIVDKTECDFKYYKLEPEKKVECTVKDVKKK